jgi:AcrR family transcriptional regulator
MATTRQPEKVGNREKLLAGAMKCLQEKGYARTTARDLVAASGANLASIGYHFGSKEALLNEAVARGVVLWAKSIEAEAFAAGGATTEERLELALAAMIDRFDELEPYLLSFVEAFPQAIRSNELRATMAAAYEDVRRSGGETFRRWLAHDGIELSPRDRDTLASLMLALCDGLILQWLLDRERPPSSANVMEALRAALPAVAR